MCQQEMLRDVGRRGDAGQIQRADRIRIAIEKKLHGAEEGMVDKLDILPAF